MTTENQQSAPGPIQQDTAQAGLQAQTTQESRPPQPPAQPDSLDDDPFVKSVKALLDHLNGQPKMGPLENLWLECRRELNKVLGNDDAVVGRTAGEEHPDYRKSGAPDPNLASRFHGDDVR